MDQMTYNHLMDQLPFYQSLKIVCPKCLHQFTPRTETRYCPKCKNVLPLELQDKIHDILGPANFCYRCGHVWHATPGHIKIARCPKCKSHKWNKPRDIKPEYAIIGHNLVCIPAHKPAPKPWNSPITDIEIRSMIEVYRQINSVKYYNMTGHVVVAPYTKLA